MENVESSKVKVFEFNDGELFYTDQSNNLEMYEVGEFITNMKEAAEDRSNICGNSINETNLAKLLEENKIKQIKTISNKEFWDLMKTNENNK